MRPCWKRFTFRFATATGSSTSTSRRAWWSRYRARDHAQQRSACGQGIYPPRTHEAKTAFYRLFAEKLETACRIAPSDIVIHAADHYGRALEFRVWEGRRVRYRGVVGRQDWGSRAGPPKPPVHYVAQRSAPPGAGPHVKPPNPYARARPQGPQSLFGSFSSEKEHLRCLALGATRPAGISRPHRQDFSPFLCRIVISRAESRQCSRIADPPAGSRGRLRRCRDDPILPRYLSGRAPADRRHGSTARSGPVVAARRHARVVADRLARIIHEAGLAHDLSLIPMIVVGNGRRRRPCRLPRPGA